MTDLLVIKNGNAHALYPVVSAPRAEVPGYRSIMAEIAIPRQPHGFGNTRL